MGCLVLPLCSESFSGYWAFLSWVLHSERWSRDREGPLLLLTHPLRDRHMLFLSFVNLMYTLRSPSHQPPYSPEHHGRVGH